MGYVMYTVMSMYMMGRAGMATLHRMDTLSFKKTHTARLMRVYKYTEFIEMIFTIHSDVNATQKFKEARIFVTSRCLLFTFNDKLFTWKNIPSV